MSKINVVNHGACITLPVKDGDKKVSDIVLYSGINVVKADLLAKAENDERVKALFTNKVLVKDGEVKEKKAPAPKKAEAKKVEEKGK